MIDPIFWLHHANCDRLFAIWQAIYPNSWFDAPQSQLPDERGTWSIPAGTRETPQTPLTPFHKDVRGGTYNSQEIRDWTIFGSSYPELQPWLPQYQTNGQFNPTLYRNDIIQQVTSLYSRVRGRVQRDTARPAAGGAPVLDRNRIFAATRARPTVASASVAPQPQPENLPPVTAAAPLAPTAATGAPTTQSAQTVPVQPQELPGSSAAAGSNPAPAPVTTPVSPKRGGLRGLMSSAQRHLDEALTAGREASQGHNQPAGANTNPKPVSGSSGLASRFGSTIGGGLHMAQERLGHFRTPSGNVRTRGLGDEDVEQPLAYHEYDVNIRYERLISLSCHNYSA